MSKQQCNKFVAACVDNQVSDVRRMISECVDINALYGAAWQGLYAAMMHNRIGIVRLLLSHRDIQMDMAGSYRALQMACRNNSVECVRLFLAHPSCNEEIVKKKVMVGRDDDGETAEMMAKNNGNHDCARLVRAYLEKKNKSDYQNMVDMLKSGETPDEGPTRLEDMTLTKVTEGIEKINADLKIIEAANCKVHDEHNKEIAKLEAEHSNKLKSLAESHKRKVDSIVDKHAVENNKYKKLRAETEERKESLHSQLQALLSPPGQPTNPPPPSSLIPECPVCLDSMKPPLQIFTCGNGHLICSVCRPKVTMDKCHCQAMYMGRATAMEQMVRQVLGII